MSHADFSVMTDEELRTYVLSHRQDQAAFHAYVDRMQQRPPIAKEWQTAILGGSQGANELYDGVYIRTCAPLL